MSDPFAGLPRNHFGAILADPPWRFQDVGQTHGSPADTFKGMYQLTVQTVHYETMSIRNCACSRCANWPLQIAVLFLLDRAGLMLLDRLGCDCRRGDFEYKTCAFALDESTCAATRNVS